LIVSSNTFHVWKQSQAYTHFAKFVFIERIFEGSKNTTFSYKLLLRADA